MATTVTTFQREKTGNLKFPTFTKWGVIENPELVSYVNDMKSFGHEWSETDIHAFDRFISNGKENGWWDSMLSIFPLYGTTPECLQVPLVQKIGVQKYATMCAFSTYNVPTPIWADIAMISNGKIIGMTPSVNRVMASPYTIAELMTVLNTTDNIVRGGYTAVVKPNTTDDNPRFFGASPANYYADGTECSFILGLNNLTTTPEVRISVGRPVTGRAIVPDDYNYLKGKIKNSPNNIGVIWGTLNNATIETADLSGYPAKPINMIVAAKLKFGIGGYPITDANGDFTDTTSKSLGSITRWLSVDKGDLEDNSEIAYRLAIKTLFDEIGK